MLVQDREENSLNPKSDIDAFCKGCYHLDEYLPACIYILHTHEKRPCAAGKGCKVKISQEEWRKFVQGQKDQEDRARKREQAKVGGSVRKALASQRNGAAPRAHDGESLSSSTASGKHTRCGNDKKPKQWTPETCEQLRRMVAGGMTGPQIADQLGTSANAVYMQIKRLGLSKPAKKTKQPSGRPKKVWTAEKTAELLRLRAQGMTHQEIGKRLGMTTRAVENRLLVLRRAEKNRKPKEADV